MRATLRITWLLLSLSLLLHVHSTEGQDPSTGPTVAAVSEAVTTPAKTNKSNEETTTAVRKTEPTTVASTVSTADVGAPATTPKSPTTTKPSDTTLPTQPQTTNAATHKPTTLLSSGTQLPPAQTGANPTAVTPTPAKSIPMTVVTPGSSSSSSSSSSGAPPQVITMQGPQSSVPGTTAKTGPSMTNPGHTGNVGTTKITKASSGPPTTGGQKAVDITVSTVAKQDSHIGVKATDKTTAAVTSFTQGTSGSTQPTRHTQTTPPPQVSTTGGPWSRAGSISTTEETKTSPIAPTAINILPPQPKTFSYSLNNGQESEEQKDLVELCRRLMGNLQDGNCTLAYRHHSGRLQVDSAEINGKVKTNLVIQLFDDITKKPTDNKTLIAILASCGALLIMIVILAVCASHHRKPYNENQQHLTEELHTVENGYHDNPTLEVMEVQPEMQEKKMALNGEFNDSWIVPIDNLLKEDIPDEEDTHL